MMEYKEVLKKKSVFKKHLDYDDILDSYTVLSTEVNDNIIVKDEDSGRMIVSMRRIRPFREPPELLFDIPTGESMLSSSILCDRHFEETCSHFESETNDRLIKDDMMIFRDTLLNAHCDADEPCYGVMFAFISNELRGLLVLPEWSIALDVTSMDSVVFDISQIHYSRVSRPIVGSLYRFVGYYNTDNPVDCRRRTLSCRS